MEDQGTVAGAVDIFDEVEVDGGIEKTESVWWRFVRSDGLRERSDGCGPSDWTVSRGERVITAGLITLRSPDDMQRPSAFHPSGDDSDKSGRESSVRCYLTVDVGYQFQ